MVHEYSRSHSTHEKSGGPGSGSRARDAPWPFSCGVAERFSKLDEQAREVEEVPWPLSREVAVERFSKLT